MKIKSAGLLISVLFTSLLNAITIDEFDALIRKYVAKKDGITRIHIIEAYARFASSIDLRLANQSLRMLLNASIEELRFQELQENSEK
jgi:hypothetical protein